MHFNVGDAVQAARPMQFGSDRIETGATGRVTQVNELGQAYWVKFEAMANEVLVSEAALMERAVPTARTHPS